MADKRIRKEGVFVDKSGKETAIMVTNMCNNNCIMCHSTTNFSPDSSTQELIKIINESIDGSEEVIQLSGGEPTLRKDLPVILKAIKQKNVKAKIEIMSNGRMFAYDKYTNDIAKLNIVDEIFIGIHGHTAELHDKISQSKGSFMQTVKGIKNLQKTRISPKIIVLVHKLNYQHLPEIAEFIKNNFGDIYVKFNNAWLGHGNYKNNAWENKDKLFVKVSEAAYYLEKAADILGDKVKFMHFPLCIFNKEYFENARSQMFNTMAKEEYPKEICTECNMRLVCRGVYNNYTEFAGSREFKSINSANQKLNFIQKLVYMDIPLAMNEIVGVKYDFKKLMMADQVKYEDYDKVKRFCEEESLFVHKMDMGGYLRLYISKDSKIIDDSIDISIKERDSTDKKRWQYINKMGEYFGYPECCRKRFIEFIRSTDYNIFPFYNERVHLYSLMKMPINYLFNSFNTSYRLINHIPCSGECDRTRRIAARMLSLFKESCTDIFNDIVRELKYPVLAWNENQFLILKGNFLGDRIEYSDVRINRIPSEEEGKCPYDINIVNHFRKGNKVITDDNYIYIYKDEELVNTIKRNGAELIHFK